MRREATDVAGVRVHGAELEPIRVKIRVYASYMILYERLSDSLPASNEFASFMMNSRERITPKRGRTSSRNLVWM